MWALWFNLLNKLYLNATVYDMWVQPVSVLFWIRLWIMLN